MKRPSQCERIIEFIKEHGSITDKQAEDALGCRRLASRIYDLKTQGYPIQSEMITVKNRWKEKCRVARYSLAEGDADANNRSTSSR
jgi:hypothetical protein